MFLLRFIIYLILIQFYADFPFDQLSSGGQLPLKALCGRIQNETFQWSGSNLAVVFNYHDDTSQAAADIIVGGMFGTFDAIDDHIVFRARVIFQPMEMVEGQKAEKIGGIIHGKKFQCYLGQIKSGGK
jgi:hypothetical protein